MLWLLPALPLGGAVFLLLVGRFSDKWGHWIGTLMALGSFGIAAWAFVEMLGRADADRALHKAFFSWVPVTGLKVDAALQLDQLSMCFALLKIGRAHV